MRRQQGVRLAGPIMAIDKGVDKGVRSLLSHKPGLNILNRFGGLRFRLLLLGKDMNSSWILFAIAGSGIRG